MWRHPLISLSALILAIGFVFDACLEIFLVRTQLYIYSQVIPFGSFAAGRVVPVPADLGVVAGVHGDDPRRRAALPRRHRPHRRPRSWRSKVRAFRGRPALGTFVVMFAVVNVGYLFLYGGGFALIRGHQGGDLGRLPVAVPRGQGVRPAAASTRRPASRARTSPASGRSGRAPSPTAWTYRPTAAAAAAGDRRWLSRGAS